MRFAALFLVLPAIHADVTIHSQTTITTSAILPPEAVAQLKKAAGQPMTMMVKGNKGYVAAGDFISITDLASQTSTYMNAGNKTFATVGLNEYDQTKVISELMPAQSRDLSNMASNIEMKVESKKTGRTEKMHGILAEERQIVMTMSMKAATAQENAGQLMRMVIELWSPAQGEAARVPALGELERFTALSRTALDPAAILQQVMAPFAGMAHGYDALAKELLEKGSVTLRMRMSMYVPALTGTASALAQSGRQVPAGFDPDGPTSQITQEMIDISTAAVDESAFNVPAAYKQSTVAEIMKARFPQLADKKQP
jgi:hypothetical protein